MEALTVDEEFTNRLRSLQGDGRCATLGVGPLRDTLLDLLDLRLMLSRSATCGPP